MESEEKVVITIERDGDEIININCSLPEEKFEIVFVDVKTTKSSPQQKPEESKKKATTKRKRRSKRGSGGPQNNVTLTGKVETETYRAYLFKHNSGLRELADKSIWWPKSQVKVINEGNEDALIAPDWLVQLKMEENK